MFFHYVWWTEHKYYSYLLMVGCHLMFDSLLFDSFFFNKEKVASSPAFGYSNRNWIFVCFFFPFWIKSIWIKWEFVWWVYCNLVFISYDINQLKKEKTLSKANKTSVALAISTSLLWRQWHNFLKLPISKNAPKIEQGHSTCRHIVFALFQ